MVKAWSALAVLWLASFAVTLAGSAQPPPASDWLTWGYDPERSGWNRAETTLSKENVSRLVLQWSAQLPIPPREIALSTLTAPLVVEGVTTSRGRRTLVFVVGSNDTVFAIDADNGKVIWQKAFPNTLTPPQAATAFSAISHASELGATMATRSPRRMPFLRSSSATAATRHP